MNQETWKCPNCGIENNSKFCEHCGQPRPVDLPENQGSNHAPIHQQNDTSKALINKKNLMIGIAFSVLIGSGAGWYYYNTYSTVCTDAIQQTEEVQEIASEISENESLNASTEAGLGKVNLGDTIESVRTNLGSEKGVEHRANNMTAYVYEDMTVIVSGNTVSALESNSEKVATKRGVHQGAALDEVIAAYGDSSIKSDFDNLVLYEYDVSGSGGNNYRIRFAVNSEKLVDYISIREVPKESGAQVKYEIDKNEIVNVAQRTLYRFHELITKHQLREAYACLSPEFQSSMSYDGWANGFKTTVRSSVSNVRAISVDSEKVVVTYDLTAVDSPGGTSHFKGTATIIRIASGWKLDEIINKK